MSNERDAHPDPMTQAIEISIRLGLLILLAVWCIEILKPFISVVAWAALLAIAAHKPFFKTKGNPGRPAENYHCDIRNCRFGCCPGSNWHAFRFPLSERR